MGVRGVEIDRRGPVAWVVMNDYQATLEAGLDELEHGDGDYVGTALGLADAFHELRFDDACRVIVVTGRNDGEFYRFSRRSHWSDPRYAGRLNMSEGRGFSFYAGRSSGAPPMLESMLLMDKPIVARVNGDVIGLGYSLLFACDIIAAREDALLADGFMGLGQVLDGGGEPRGFPWAMTPNGSTLAQLSFPPTKLKELMLLSTSTTARELAAMNVINHAVPMDELDAVVDEIVEKLLARPASVLAHTKRVCNKNLIAAWNLTSDLSSAYFSLDNFQHGAAGEMQEEQADA
jgi:enoyl-CoA hydratase